MSSQSWGYKEVRITKHEAKNSLKVRLEYQFSVLFTHKLVGTHVTVTLKTIGCNICNDLWMGMVVFWWDALVAPGRDQGIMSHCAGVERACHTAYWRITEFLAAYWYVSLLWELLWAMPTQILVTRYDYKKMFDNSDAQTHRLTLHCNFR